MSKAKAKAAEAASQAEKDRLERYQNGELNAKEEKLRADFMALDEDNDGIVSIDDVGKLLRAMRTKLRMSESEIKRTLREFDMDGDGEITVSEFLFIMGTTKKKDLIHKAIMQNSAFHHEFKQYEVDNIGYITKEKFMKVYESRTGGKPSEEEFDKMLKGAGVKEDGQVGYWAFLHLLVNTHYRSAV